ncbi:hypothetical protein SNOG_09912 [Parastagonospora nodorum SN15]|uniref:Uncharacterized protein n=2 Tax=Phaeosphaeria nodorum (strain SN15 / ATCC MYA-4574 / FGSC 10173) TaxID=321614 RepID=A0A7U2FD99_PHANO|nr:hypothetical protein SNOG_09912 [Parastagonospora nodorum SN15]EAT82247.1 hypothetical protein SNOG_09912 [Parastagonospora nodorum SN15]QRD03143.1 hypothetical protein JI435_099120 [Parastagonospora nodorum SN15]
MSIDIYDMVAKLYYLLPIALNVPANRLLVAYTKAIIMTATTTITITAPALLL